MSHPSSHLIPEIQGLRAVAVVAVLIYHVWPWLLPGGYVGVDVFFVISGYLITGSLFKEFEASGRIGIAGFYARRIRRLLPAATLVSLFVALTLPLFSRAQWSDIVSSLVASALYVQNWFLAAQAVDYLADDAKGPMNHFWSLSVEEQYYIVWPLLLWPLMHLARKASLSPRAAFGWFIGLIATASLAYSVYLTRQNPGVAYFATTTRAWELALGGALAVFPWSRALSGRWRAALGPLGLGAIALACWTYSEDTQFPGYAALLPTLGAAAVILSSGAAASWSARGLLGSRPFQFVGDISYSLYLWHWPLIVLYSEVTGSSPGLWGGAVLLLGSLALAHLSKIFVEDPFRSLRFALRPTLAAGAACIAVTAGAGAVFLVRDAGDPVQVAGPELRGARAMTDPAYDWRQENLQTMVPAPEKVKKDLPDAYASGCRQGQIGTEVLACVYGDPKGKLKIVMLGDSHAVHLFPALQEIARKESVYFLGVSKSACLFSLEAIYHFRFKRPYTECLKWSNDVIEWLGRERPDIVLISQSPAYSLEGLPGMAAAWSRLVKMGLDVRAIRSTPWMPFDPGRCLIVKSQLKDCVPLRATLFGPDPTLMTAQALGIKILDLTGSVCDAVHCPVVIGGVLVYRDEHHFTATFARTLSQAIKEQLPLPLTGSLPGEGGQGQRS